jgi:hypothetical protein
MIVKDRWYSAVAVVALALGIGVNATVFTLVNGVLIRGLPFKDSGNLYMLSSQRLSETRGGAASLADLQDWRAQQKSSSDSRHSTTRARTSVTSARRRSRRASAAHRQHLRGASAADSPRTRFRSRGRSEGAERVALIGYALENTVWRGSDRAGPLGADRRHRHDHHRRDAREHAARPTRKSGFPGAGQQEDARSFRFLR